ncbi:MAG: aromatic ring-hydroxylating oxygenase subunit alpha, partial [Gammaproteobacteria bacterium]
MNSQFSPASKARSLPARTGELLAPWTYFDDEILALEKEHIFRKHWLFLCHACEIPSPGDYLAFDIIDERVLVLRGDDGVVRTFHNICRHRGSRVVRDDAGNCPRAIACPFHGWTYDLKGNLRGVPAAKTFANLDQSRVRLVEIEHEIWNGLVFIRFGGEGPSIAEMLRPLESRLAPYRIAELEPISARSRDVASVNWKAVHDIDNEGYHVPVGHPGLNSLVYDYLDEALENGVFASFSTLKTELSPHWSVARYQKLLPRAEHLPDEDQRSWWYVGIFPHVVFSLTPDMFDFYQTFPLETGKTLLVSRSYGLPNASRQTRAARYLNMRINKQVSAEDRQLVRWLSESLRSSALPREHLSSTEACVTAYHDLIR